MKTQFFFPIEIFVSDSVLVWFSQLVAWFVDIILIKYEVAKKYRTEGRVLQNHMSTTYPASPYVQKIMLFLEEDFAGAARIDHTRGRSDLETNLFANEI